MLQQQRISFTYPNPVENYSLILLTAESNKIFVLRAAIQFFKWNERNEMKRIDIEKYFQQIICIQFDVVERACI